MTENNLPALPGAAGVPAHLPTSYGRSEAGSDEDGPKGGGLKRYLAAVRRYKWIVIGLAVAGTSAAAFFSRYAPLKYQAQATFWFEATNREEANRGPIQSSELLQGEAWSDLMRSFSVLDHVVQQERMYLRFKPKDSEVFQTFRLDSMYATGAYTLKVDASGKMMEIRDKQGTRWDQKPVGDSIGRAKLGFRWRPDPRVLTPKRVVSFHVISDREAAIELNRNLKSPPARGGTIMSIQYTGDFPERVTRVVNGVAERFVEVAANLKRGKLEDLSKILKAQMDLAQLNLESAELAQQNFGINTITLPSDRSTPVTPGLGETRAPVLNAFFNMRISRESVQADRDAITKLLAKGGDSLSIDALSVIGEVRGSPELNTALMTLATKRAELRTMRQTYTSEWPGVKDLEETIRNLQAATVPQLGDRLLANLDAKLAVMDNTINSASSELKAIPPRAMTEARLSRNVTIANDIYNDLKRRYENARLSSETTIADVRIVDKAKMPDQPISDPRIQLSIMGLVGSLALGLMIAILLDRMDPRIHYAEQVSDELRMSIIGAVPSLGGARKRLNNPEEASKVVESLRGIRLSLMHAYGTAGPLMLTISSPGSGDGKTFITSNLALTFADLGLRTLIIDGDTRRGELHKLLDTQRKPGLTDFLGLDAEVEDVIRPTKYPLVDLIPGGTRRSDAPELLSTPRMGELLAAIRPRYQVILIDSPPLGAGVDPLVLATLSGNIVLVMRTGKTDRVLAQAKLEMLDRLPIRILGAILNGFDESTAYRYYSYLPGYEAANEEKDDAGTVLQPA